MRRQPSLDDFLPGSPDWSVDWEGVDAAFPWFAKLYASTQDPYHHAEGDVGTHTRMVVEELAASPEFREAPLDERRVAFASAMLHDVMKPETRVEEGGRVSNPGHSRLGAGEARKILWRMGFPMALREQVCAVIAVHQIPFYLHERLGTERQWQADHLLARTSLLVPNRVLAMVAEADAKGRVCADRARIVENVEMFREMARDMGCYDAPFPFHNDHTRLRFFRDPERVSPYAQIYDDTDAGFTVTILSGLPGCGKSTWTARESAVGGICAGQPVVSLDALRIAMGVAPEDNQGTVRQAAKEAAKAHLRARQPFIWDGTNLDPLRRGPITALADDYGARVRIVYVEAPEPEMRAANRARSARVPDEAIDRMIHAWDPPTAVECHELLLAVRDVAPQAMPTAPGRR